MIVALYSYTSQSGKDTVADFIAEWAEDRGKTFSRSAFADRMKIVCADALGITWPGPGVDPEIEGTEDEWKIHTIDLLKLSGTVLAHWTEDDGALEFGGRGGRAFIIGLAESIRRLDPEFWIRHGMPPAADVQVITDLRFLPEARAVTDQVGRLVEVHRSGTVHRNEDDLRGDCHFTIVNDSSLSDLRWTTYRVMDQMFPQ